MTKPDQPTETPPVNAVEDADEPRDFSDIKRIAIGTIGGFVLVFLLAFTGGYFAGVLESRTPDLYDITVFAVLVAMIAATAWGMWRLWPAAGALPEASSVKRSRTILYAMVFGGAVLGVVLAFVDGPNVATLGEGPINPVAAGIAIAVWLIVVPATTWMWLRSVDEHEAIAYHDGASVAVHAYLFIAPAWWLAAKAGWIEPQDPMIVFLAVCIIWSVVWFVKKYR